MGVTSILECGCRTFLKEWFDLGWGQKNDSSRKYTPLFIFQSFKKLRKSLLGASLFNGREFYQISELKAFIILSNPLVEFKGKLENSLIRFSLLEIVEFSLRQKFWFCSNLKWWHSICFASFFNISEKECQIYNGKSLYLRFETCKVLTVNLLPCDFQIGFFVVNLLVSSWRVIYFVKNSPPQLSWALLSRHLVVPAQHAIFIQKIFDCHLTATSWRTRNVEISKYFNLVSYIILKIF